MEIRTDLLEKSCSELGVNLCSEQLGQFRQYYEMLVEKNRVMNLTAITDWEEVVVKHFSDSLSLVRVMDLNRVSTVIDLGTGAGFPGIPLKIAFPRLNILLADSLGKRVRFLEEVIRECGLDQSGDITAIHGRAEDLARRDIYREHFDLCVSRAVANLPVLCEYCLPFVRVGGDFVAYKSGKVSEEIRESKKAVKILGGRFAEETGVESFLLPGTDISRTLVRIRKEKTTPAAYPRKAGLPSREPIRS